MHVLYPPMARPRILVGTDSESSAPIAVKAAAMLPPTATKRQYRGARLRAWPTAMMERAKRRFPARMKGTRFPDRSDRWPIGIRKRALAAAWHVKISPVWAMETPASRAYRGKKAKREPQA